MHTPTWSRQLDFDRRLEWGPTGAGIVEAGAIAIVVDVLRFTTSVDVGTARGAAIYPHRWDDSHAVDFASSVGAQLVNGRDPKGRSLSPVSLEALGPEDKIVLPSLNGSTCAVIASEAGAVVVAGCLRNAAAIAAQIRGLDRPVVLIPSGERWPDGSLRPALEDFLGAGAILSQLGGKPSPEAQAAIAAWREAEKNVRTVLMSSSSGVELVYKGEADDVEIAAMVDVSDNVPVIRAGAFRSVREPGSRFHDWLPSVVEDGRPTRDY